ncbi:MAG: 1-phosphofructokinase family hexose kinase [Anaerolineae bacterium]|nr:1-phosphofructokinase family hexose kinase [Anaerolineae bacterium]MDW8172662.1 1-phosphofructokinase family hexose kinase [Anaerolineae bacterium]
MSQQTIVTLTFNPAVDKSSSVESVASEIKLRCAPPQFHPGGGGINVSRAIAKLGGQSRAVYASGGPSGAMLEGLLRAEGLDGLAVPIQDLTRENLTVLETTTSLQYRFNMPGPVIRLDEAQACVQAALALQPAYLVASGSLGLEQPADTYAQLAERLRGTPTRLIVDTSGPALEAMQGAQAFLLKPNLDEIEALSGEKFSGQDELIEVARHLIARKLAQVLLVSMGASGALLVTDDEAVHLRPPVVPIQSKVGAGDSMVGGLTLALARGWTIRDAARYGVASGSAAVMTPGTELCRLQDVEKLYPRVTISEHA